METTMTYAEWEQDVPHAIQKEPVWRFYGYRKALFLYDMVWQDCAILVRDPRGRAVSNQLIRSTGSISANIEEGHGRGWRGKERRLYLRYALASARETKGWYYRGRSLFTTQKIEHRISILDEVIALLAKEISIQQTQVSK